MENFNYLTDEQLKPLVRCLSCLHCLPPEDRVDGNMCILSHYGLCHFSSVSMELEIQVDELLNYPAGSSRCLLRNIIPYNDSIVFPYNTVVSSLKAIFPNKKLVINFKII